MDVINSNFGKDNSKVQVKMANLYFRKRILYSSPIQLSRYKDIPKAIMDDTRWGSDMNFKAFLPKERMKTVTQLWLRTQTIFLFLFIWVPLDFSKLC